MSALWIASNREPGASTSKPALGAIRCKARRHPWHLRQRWHCGICNLQNLKDRREFESHSLRHTRLARVASRAGFRVIEPPASPRPKVRIPLSPPTFAKRSLRSRLRLAGPDRRASAKVARHSAQREGGLPVRSRRASGGSLLHQRSLSTVLSAVALAKAEAPQGRRRTSSPKRDAPRPAAMCKRE